MTATSRAGQTTFTQPTDREIVITRVVDAPRGKVFDAWTIPDQVKRWLLGPAGWTMPICEIDLRPGGKYRYVWRRGSGTEMQITGTYREVARPERVVFSESWGNEWPETLNTLTLTEQDGSTTMTLTLLYPSKAARDAAAATGMRDGVEASYERLVEYLRG